MALRSDRHRIRPIAALALDAGTTIGPRCATIHVGQEAARLRIQAGYTTATGSKIRRSPSLACIPGGVHIRAAKQRPMMVEVCTCSSLTPRSSRPHSRFYVVLGRSLFSNCSRVPRSRSANDRIRRRPFGRWPSANSPSQASPLEARAPSLNSWDTSLPRSFGTGARAINHPKWTQSPGPRCAARHRGLFGLGRRAVPQVIVLDQTRRPSARGHRPVARARRPLLAPAGHGVPDGLQRDHLGGQRGVPVRPEAASVVSRNCLYS